MCQTIYSHYIPPVSISGEGSLKRFKKNADNLGGLVINAVNKITLFEVTSIDDASRKSIRKYLKNKSFSSDSESKISIVRVGE